MTAPAVPAALALVVGVWAGVRLGWPPVVAQLVALAAWGAAAAAVCGCSRPRRVAVTLVAGFCAAGVLLGASRRQEADAMPLASWFAEQAGAESGRVGPLTLEGRLQAAALSHGDPDHAGGLGAVLRDFRPLEVWDGVPVPGHAGLEQLREQVDRLGLHWRQVARVDSFRFGSVSMRVTHPHKPDWERVRVRNDDSVVLDVRYGGVAVLLPGDIGREVEGSAIASVSPAPFRIVKVPHHGSAGSSTARFVETLSPCLAIVSAGRANAFGHPAPEVVQRYRGAVGALVLETAREGAITVETDGAVVEVRTEAGRRWSFRADAVSCLPLGSASPPATRVPIHRRSRRAMTSRSALDVVQLHGSGG